MKDKELIIKLGKFVAEWTGSCPLDTYDWKECPAVKYDKPDECEKKYQIHECWIKYIRVVEK